MTKENKHEKFQFWMNWTLLSFVIIPVSYMISLIVVLLVHGAFGFSQMEGGTYLSQTVMQIAGGAVIGLGTGLYQKSLLRKVFSVSSSWIYSLVIGFAITELIVCIILWQLNLNRYELRFIEFRPLPEALIFASAGLIIGLLQWPLLGRYFSRSIFWIIACVLGWGICVFVTQISIWAFCLGALMYGAITGAALMWILQRKDEGR
jgi:hypothetical protein